MDSQSDLQFDCYANNQNMKSDSSVDPIVNERMVTRRMAYKKSVDEFLKAQEKITEEAKKKSCPPILFRAHCENTWIYPKDRAQIVLLKCDNIKPIKRPNYVHKRKYRSKQAKFSDEGGYHV